MLCSSLQLPSIISYSILFSLACTCNSQGSTKHDDSACENKCCNLDGSCKCKAGYSGNDCNTCEVGYYVSATVNGDNSCTGEEL